MEIEVTKEEAQRMLEKARHKENKESFRLLAELLKKNSNKEVVDAIRQQTEKINQFLSAITSLPTPIVNVDVNQDKSVTSFDDNTQLILKGLEEIKNAINVLNQPKEWNFLVKRDSYNGYIESVKATMVINKPKYQA